MSFHTSDPVKQAKETPEKYQHYPAPNSQVFSDADIGNISTVARIMKAALPDNAKIAREAKECMQECVSEFISFITSEGKSWFIASGGIGLLLINANSLGKVSAGEKENGQWRRYLICHDFIGV